MAANDLRATSAREPLSEEVAKAGNPKGAYVHPDRIRELQAIKNKEFDLTKLLRQLMTLVHYGNVQVPEIVGRLV